MGQEIQYVTWCVWRIFK